MASIGLTFNFKFNWKNEFMPLSPEQINQVLQYPAFKSYKAKQKVKLRQKLLSSKLEYLQIAVLFSDDTSGGIIHNLVEDSQRSDESARQLGKIINNVKEKLTSDYPPTFIIQNMIIRLGPYDESIAENVIDLTKQHVNIYRGRVIEPNQPKPPNKYETPGATTFFAPTIHQRRPIFNAGQQVTTALNENETPATTIFFSLPPRKRSLLVNTGLHMAATFFKPGQLAFGLKILQTILSINSIFDLDLNVAQKITDGLQGGLAFVYAVFLMVLITRDETCFTEPPSGNLCASISTLNLINYGILLASIAMDYKSQPPDSQQTPLARAST